MKRVRGLIVGLCFVFVTSLTPAFAGEKKEQLTVGDAVKLGISTSSSLRSYEESEILLEQNNESLEESKFTASSGSVEGIYLQLMQNEYKAIQNSNEKRVLEEKMYLTVTDYFVNIINAEKSLELYDKSIALQKKDLTITQLKYTLGLVSDTDYEKAQSSYNKLIDDRKNKELTITNSYIELNKFMGRALENQYELVLELEYKPLGDVNLTETIRVAKVNSVDLQTKLNDQELAQYKVDTYSAYYSSGTEESHQISLEQAKRAVADLESNIEQKVVSLYNSITKLELDYDANVKNLATLKQDLALLELKLELGKATQLEIDKQKYSIEQTEETIRSLEYDHAAKRMQFESPWLL